MKLLKRGRERERERIALKTWKNISSSSSLSWFDNRNKTLSFTDDTFFGVKFSCDFQYFLLVFLYSFLFHFLPSLDFLKLRYVFGLQFVISPFPSLSLSLSSHFSFYFQMFVFFQFKLDLLWWSKEKQNKNDFRI